MRTYAEDIPPNVPSKGAKSNMYDQRIFACKNTIATSGQKVGGMESAYPACWTSGQTKLWISHGTLNVVADVPRREFSGRFQVIPALAMAHGFRELA
ncbi:hypothetical protein V1478_002978 [Vespula squamosa]|uniref:Uncharacterized protein n=1 Tax=Vespula squamosa TaxID=30214 RepID=A0ABD2BRC4_VESSQ